LIESYEHGVNAYVVKPVDFSEFVKAVKRLGIFWAAINEPPPLSLSEESLRLNPEVMSQALTEAT
jgi:DNA-binding NarL/FixJ family response regulator